LPVFTSQSLATSPPAEARSFESGLKATELTPPAQASCPEEMVRSSFQVFTSQSRIRRSSWSPVARSLPSGLKATDSTWPSERRCTTAPEEVSMTRASLAMASRKARYRPSGVQLSCRASPVRASFEE
jgi:hypothetical protein